MASRAADILSVGMITPIGTSATETAASARAGVARMTESSVHNRSFDPMTLALLPEVALPPLEEKLEGETGLTSRQIRMLRLAGAALAEAARDRPAPISTPVMLGAPDALPGRSDPAGERFLQLLREQSGVMFSVEPSRVFSSGRAAFFEALQAGLAMLASRQAAQVLVGGVDSYLDLYLLGTLDAESRVIAEGAMDGFIPGEGAAFLLLGRAGEGTGPVARVLGAATAEEPGHRYSDEPYRGDGLPAAVRNAATAAGLSPGSIAVVYAGLNGENFGAKEWGTTFARNREYFAEDLRIEHPVDCMGDAGAGLGAILMSLAALGIGRGRISAPVLVWGSSDRALRGAAVVGTAAGA